ncbi:hypothetical protein [Vaginella massiliensis]|uniref:hypothetical protein n=1 Tax=Vaginella massiliensis TaxID=1816680 RepID=UPI0012B65FC3|nr:hypothetical protein [Vaginella massiliensis]
MKKFLFFLLFCFAKTAMLLGQTTTLDKGDIVVVGVNLLNHNNNCDTKINQQQATFDNIFLVGLKDIEKGTRIIVTDNAYIGNNTFKVNEGAYELERVDETITKGTVFRIDFTSGKLIAGPNGDKLNGWKLINRKNIFGLNTDGDQFFILHGSKWEDSQFWKDQKIIAAYNSKNYWLKKEPINSSNSLLPSSSNSNTNLNIENYHFTPKDSNQRYRYYNGPLSQTSKNEWLIRLLNPNNWTYASDCSTMMDEMKNFKKIEISETSEIEVCAGENFKLSIEYDSEIPSGSIQTNFQWKRSVNSNLSNPENVGAGRDVNIPLDTAGVYYFYCEITYQLKWQDCETNKPSECIKTSKSTVKSKVFKVTVNQVQTSPINRLN